MAGIGAEVVSSNMMVKASLLNGHESTYSQTTKLNSEPRTREKKDFSKVGGKFCPFFPKDIAIENGIGEDFCQLLFTEGCNQTHMLSVLELFGHFGVDLMQPLSKNDVSKEVSKMNTMTLESILQDDTSNANAMISKRLGDGKLSSFQITSQDADFEKFQIHTLFETSESWYFNKCNPDDDGYNSDSSDGDSYRRGRRYLSGLRNAPEHNKLSRILLGPGFAKINVGGVPVLAWCFTENEKHRMAIILAAENDKSLRETSTIAVSWRDIRDNKGLKPKDGCFKLYRFIADRKYDDPKWKRVDTRTARSKESVILPGSMQDDIIADVESFLSKSSQEWYESHGIPQRRSFLFYGPPGCGKTSTINMLSGMFKLSACFLTLTSKDFSNENLHDAITTLPSSPLLVLEDVDVLFNTDRENMFGNSVTFSGLLNALDGLISSSGVISVFTTNHIDQLDAALTRAGRIDRRFEFKKPGNDQIKGLFNSFYPKASDDLAQTFADTIMLRGEPEARSMATLQQHFIFTRTMSPEESVDRVDEFFQKHYHGSKAAPSFLYS